MWLVGCLFLLIYMKTPPTHYYLESITVDEHPPWIFTLRGALHTHTRSHDHANLMAFEYHPKAIPWKIGIAWNIYSMLFF